MEMKEIYTHMRQLNAGECADRLAKLEADYRSTVIPKGWGRLD